MKQQSFNLIFFLICMVSLSCYAKSEEVYIDDIVYNIDTENRQAAVARQNPYGLAPNVKTALIPENIVWNEVTYPVVALDEMAFYNCPNLTKVAIPNSVVSIGEEAFRYCKALVEVILPKNLTALSKGMFDGCESLETIDLPTAITVIPEFCFQNCKSLKSIVIPEGVTTIGSQAFWYTYALASITIPSSLKKLDGTLSGAGWPLVPTIHISDMNSFCNIICSGDLCGNNCWYLQLNGEEVTEVIIPDGTKDISIWKRCESLESITTPTSVESCDFYSSNLKFISMSASTKEVNIWGIDDHNLKRVDIYSPQPPQLTTSTWEVGEAILHVPVGCKGIYENSEEWSMFASIIDDLTDDSGIDEIQNDINYSLPYEIFSIQGTFIGNSLNDIPHGIYILRQGESCKKILVR
mgnify:CR=1 FL=1